MPHDPGILPSLTVQFEDFAYPVGELHVGCGLVEERAVGDKQVPLGCFSGASKPTQYDWATTDLVDPTVDPRESLCPTRQYLFSRVGHRFGRERQECFTDHPQVYVGPLGRIV